MADWTVWAPAGLSGVGVSVPGLRKGSVGVLAVICERGSGLR